MRFVQKHLIYSEKLSNLPSNICVKGIGVDVCHMSRFKRILKCYDDYQVLSYLYSKEEYYACISSENFLLAFSSCFSAKEAISKALGTGMAGMSWRDIEVFIHEQETFQIKLSNLAYQNSLSLGILKWHVWRRLIQSTYVCVGVVGYE